MVNILVVFDGRAFGVVTGGGRSGGKAPEQTAGVLLLSINELLHKTLPGEHNHQQEQENVINFDACFPSEVINML